MKSRVRFVYLIAMWLVSCAAPAPTSQPIPISTPTAPTSTPRPLPASTIKPTRTATLTPTAIPGFEDWSVFNAQAVNIQSENGSLIMTLIRHALWFMQQRGVLIYKPVSGDFKITADVYTAKHSDPSQAPGGDSSVQLGGVMARNGDGGRENYVFIVVGDDNNGLSVETKNTTDGNSKYEGPAWDSKDAALRLCRVGQTFNLYKRHVNANEPWTLAASFDRPDLPDTLQVGANIYTDSDPDLTIRYDHLVIEPIASRTDCEKD